MKGIVWNGSIDVTDELEVRRPGASEVLVHIAYAGVCHSDYSVVNGTIAFPTPVVLGHEGAGVVEAVGSAVTKVAVGEHVVLHTLSYCGACDQCDRGRPTHCRSSLGGLSQPFSYKGAPAYTFAKAGVFSELTVVHENQAVPMTTTCRCGWPRCSVAPSSPAPVPPSTGPKSSGFERGGPRCRRHRAQCHPGSGSPAPPPSSPST